MQSHTSYHKTKCNLKLVLVDIKNKLCSPLIILGTKDHENELENKHCVSEGQLGVVMAMTTRVGGAVKPPFRSMTIRAEEMRSVPRVSIPI